jgi:hypothetical protein
VVVKCEAVDESTDQLNYASPKQRKAPEFAAAIFFFIMPLIALAGLVLGLDLLRGIGSFAALVAFFCALGGWVEHRHDSSSTLWAIAMVANALASTYALKLLFVVFVTHGYG